MEEKIKKYHETLLEERRIKEELIKKLKAIRRVVHQYKPNNGRRSRRTAAKAAGIPFGLSTLAKGIFMAPDNIGDNPQSNADRIVDEIKRILN